MAVGLVTSLRLGDQYVLRGLEVILQILRIGDHFCGDYGASAPPPSFVKLVFWFLLQN